MAGCRGASAPAPAVRGDGVSAGESLVRAEVGAPGLSIVPLRLLLLLEDITLRKQVEATLAQQVQELEALAAMKDDFLNTVSHELRAPMTNIRLVLELLPAAETEAEMMQYLEILDQECNRETDLINELLDFQRLQSEGRSPQWQAIDLETWLPRLLQPYQDRADSQRQLFCLHRAPVLPAITSDRPGLEQIVGELLNNACKYTPLGGRIDLTVAVQAAQLQLVVHNTGAEISANHLPHIFDRFYRVPQTDLRHQGGTGLGLALVKQLVEGMGGDIWVQSDRKGTTFTVELPLQEHT
jgi:signal transduction histidine kinase